MKVLVSGGSGLVGRYIVNGLIEAGHQVVVGGRTRPAEGWFAGPVEFMPLTLDPERDQSAAFAGTDAFVHAAFDHIPGKYRGGEGDDPERFRHVNFDGSVRLFLAAKAARVRHVVFLSSRAVYDGLPPSTTLWEDTSLRPTSLYGEIKYHAEQALAALAGPDFLTASLRLTGVYGDIRPNKWDDLFTRYLAGLPIEPRAGTEVHGRDVAAAVNLMLKADASKADGHVFNVSDILTDTADILAEVQQTTGSPHPLPPHAPGNAVSVMPTDRIRQLGWQAGGLPLLRETIRRLTSAFSAPTGFSAPDLHPPA